MPGTRARPHDAPQGDLPTASLAHELKTPLAASEAAITNLRERLPQLLKAAPRPGGNPEWAAILAFAARHVMTPAPAPLTGLQGQRRARDLAKALRKAGAGALAERAADVMVRCGWDTHLDEIAPVLGSDQGDEALALLDAAGRIRASVWSLANSLDRIEEIMTRAGRGAGEAGRGVADLRECAEAAVEILQHATPPGVHVEIADRGRPFAAADAVRVEQILTNLVGNALDAVSPEGGRIAVECATAEGRATVQVRDNGPGIPGGVRESLFDPFSTSKEKGKGTGLGLYISRTLAEEMGGTLELTRESEATCFRLSLPAAAAEDGT